MNSKAGRILLVIGSAPGIGEDIARFFDMGVGRDRVDYMLIGFDAVENVSAHCLYFATYHPDEIQRSKERRHRYGGNTDFLVISHQQQAGDVEMVVPIIGPSGSSAMLGCLAAIQIGYERIVLCGCPLHGTNDKGSSYEGFRQGFEYEGNRKQIMGKVKSMSGWTAEFLGDPTEEWLNG